MSVKFEKETVKDAPIPGGRKHEIAHEIGERLTGGETAQGYLAVRRTTKGLEQDTRTNGYSIRPTSSSSRRIPSGRRCSLRERYQLYKKSLPPGSPKMSPKMDTISALECLRWLSMARSLARLWDTS